MKSVLSYLNSVVLERSAEIEGVVLSLLSGCPLFFYGPPGTAKTKLISAAAEAFNLSTFDILLSQTTKPESVFGPVDIPALAKGQQFHKTAGYAPESNVIFFDEIFRANGIVLDNLLWLVNERRFRNGDKGIMDCPILTVFSASNEIPTDSTLAAIYDRFVLRYNVQGLRSTASLIGMVNSRFKEATPDKLKKFTLKEVHKMRSEVSKISIPEDVQRVAFRICDQVFRATGFKASDRRLYNAFTVVQARAYLRGGEEAVLDDLEVLSNILWADPINAERVRGIVLSNSSTEVSDMSSFLKSAEDIFDTAMKSGAIPQALAKLAKLAAQLSNLTSQSSKQTVLTIEEKASQLQSLLDQRATFILIRMMTNNCMWYKVADATTIVWSAKQLRAAGFHYRIRDGYWHLQGPKGNGEPPEQLRRAKFKQATMNRVKKILGVDATIQVLS